MIFSAFSSVSFHAFRSASGAPYFLRSNRKSASYDLYQSLRAADLPEIANRMHLSLSTGKA